MKALRHTAVYALIVLACMSSAAWQPEPAAEVSELAVRIAHGDPIIDVEEVPTP